MEMTFLGSGSAFVESEYNFQSNMILSKKVGNEIKRLVIDVGTTFNEALKYSGYTLNDIDGIFITHKHADHIGGLEALAFKTYFSTFPFGQRKIHLYGFKETLETLWEHSLKGGMASVQGQSNTLETYFETHYIENNGSFNFFGTEFKLVQTVHIVDDRSIIPSHGLIFEENKLKIFITGDTQFAPNQLLTYYQQVDFIFQDCELADYPQSVHAQYHQLLTLNDNIKNKMFLYHHDNGITELPNAKSDGFLGFVKRKETFNFFEMYDYLMMENHC